jgi:hypothetical protein
MFCGKNHARSYNRLWNETEKKYEFYHDKCEKKEATVCVSKGKGE